MTIKTLVGILILCISTFLTGCGARIESVGPKFDINAYGKNPNEGQKISGAIGTGVGGLLGVPLTLITLPVTIPIACFSDGHMKGLVFICPMVYSMCGVSNITGAISWPFLGWWNCDDKKLDKSELDKK